ncbi:MAG: alkaline phosphatase family protein [Gemmatimonadota bacterium]|nr:alkaline phosphatase family protein [Gemmatimonadota bacterium]
MTSFRPALLLAILAAVPAAAQTPERRTPPSPAEVPALVVFITVDQLRPDYFDRWRGQLTGGLARLAGGGAFFTDAYHDHAHTETAPGHASTLSGRFPRGTGIVRNSAGVQDPQAPLIDAAGPGASPFRFRGSTLFDWLRGRDPRSRALSVSRKDRGAILPIGRDPQDVYWFADAGTVTTSTWYRDTLPEWVQRFNARRLPHGHAGRAWTLLLPDSAYPEPDSVAIESGGRDFVFPHVMPDDSATAARQLGNFPWMDEVTIAFALDGMREMRLGAGPQTDLMAISLSATDFIGHRFGPDSRELHDQILRLDRMLAVFLDSVFAMRDSAKVVIALTSDHGVAPYPEVREARGRGRAVKVDLAPLVMRLEKSLASRGVDSTMWTLEGAVLLLDSGALARKGVRADSVARAFASDARRVPGVMRADLVSSLARRDTVRDAIARRWYHALPPDFPAAVVVTLEPYAVPVWAPVAMHGSPHDYDAHVPVIFYGRQFKPGRYDRFARVVDMAPTLAWVTAVTPTERLDGRVLWEALR